MKYIALLIGLAALFFSVTAWITYEPVNEEAEPLTILDASRLEGTGPRYISLPADMDVSQRLYRTGLSEPNLTTQDPDTVHALTADIITDAQRMGALLGCPVRVNSIINPMNVGAMKWIRRYEDGSKPDVVESERFIAPVLGTDHRLLVLSPSFTPDAAAGDEWKKRPMFEGRLSRLADIESNASNITHGPDFLQANLGVPAGAFVIITETGVANDFRSHLVPIRGSNSTLFLDVTPEQEQQFVAAGRITGLLKTRASSNYDIDDVLGIATPQYIGLITDETAASYNAGMHSVYVLGMMFGLLMSGLSGGAIFLKHKIRQHNRRKIANIARQFEQGRRSTAA